MKGDISRGRRTLKKSGFKKKKKKKKKKPT